MLDNLNKSPALKKNYPHMLGSKYVALFNREHINELSAQAK